MSLAPLRNRSVRQQALTLALAVAALGMAWQARAQTINVSRLVMGTQQTPPAESLPTAACQGCSYVTVHAAGATTSFTTEPGPYLANTWPPAYGTSFNRPGPASEPIDIGSVSSAWTPDGGSIGAVRRARAQFDTPMLIANPVRELAVQTWRTGSGRAITSHAIRIQPTGTAPVATYLEFTKPQDLRAINYARDTQPDYSNSYTRPLRFQASTTVDITIDGLPVWTSTRLAMLPRNYVPTSLFDHILINGGENLGTSSSDRVTLFLGLLPPGETRQVSIVLSSDLRAEVKPSNDCEYDNGPAVTSPQWRCHSQREGLTQPGTAVSAIVGVRPAIRVFTR